MKLKTLEIHNIASIEDATIDFSGDILANQDIFLICGPTGSGKTTILDAICLALFNKTPRMERSSKREVINAFAEKDSVNKLQDTLHLVRKNAVDAYVKLTFESDGHDYTAFWHAFRIGQYRKGKETSTFSNLSLEEKVGKKLDYEWMLIEDDGKEFKKEVEKEIINVIKMNFDQFCKTTMLAQGDFTKFLGSSSDEKAQILEKLVGTEQYAEVGCVINRTANEKKSEIDLLSKELANSIFLDETQIAEKQKEIDSLSEQIKSISVKQTEITKKIQWIDGHTKATEAVANGKVNLEIAEKELQTEDFLKNQQIIKLWDQTADVRNAITTERACIKKAEENDAAEKKLFENFSEAMAGLCFIKGRLNELKNTSSILQASIDEQSDYAEMFGKVDVICSKQDAIIANQNTISEKTPVVKTYDEKIKEQESVEKTLEQKKLEENNEIAILEEDSKAKNELLRKQGADTIDEEISRLNKRKTDVVETNHALQSLNESLNDYSYRQQAVKTAGEELDAFKTAEKKASEGNEKAKETAEESRLIYEKAYISLDDHARALRAKLTVGDNCPVCGTIIDQIINDEELKSALQPLEEKCKADAEKAQQASTALAQATAKMLSARQTLEKALKEEKQAKITLETRKEVLKQKCEALGIECNQHIAEQIDAIIRENDLTEEALTRKQKGIKTIRDEINANAEKIASHRRNILTIDKEITNIKSDISTYRGKREQIAGAIENAKGIVETNTEEIKALLNPQWKPQQSDKFFDELKTAATKYFEAKNTLNDNNNAVSALNIDIEQIESCKKNIDKLFPQWEDKNSTFVSDIPDVRNKCLGIQTKAVLLHKSMQENDEQWRNAKSEITKFKERNPEIDMKEVEELLNLSHNQITVLRKTIESLITSHSKAQAVYDEAVKHRKEFAESPLEEGETKESLNHRWESLENERNTCAEKKGSIQKEIETDKENRQLHGKKMDELEIKRKEYSEWETLNKYLGNTDGKNFRNVAQSFILSELLDKANAYLANISSRYKLFCHPGTLTIMMRDAYQGGIERPTNTLSGGESFIISLSLALGLSSMQNVDFEVDTLFIDEGFGTLSSEIIDPVITSLKRLNETYGRRLGIISHIDALKQRVPVSIEVTRQGSSSSRIEVKRN